MKSTHAKIGETRKANKRAGKNLVSQKKNIDVLCEQLENVKNVESCFLFLSMKNHKMNYRIITENFKKISFDIRRVNMNADSTKLNVNVIDDQRNIVQYSAVECLEKF